MNAQKVQVTLPVSDWTLLVNFASQDLNCMDEDDRTKLQMLKICDEIRNSVSAVETKNHQHNESSTR